MPPAPYWRRAARSGLRSCDSTHVTIGFAWSQEDQGDQGQAGRRSRARAPHEYWYLRKFLPETPGVLQLLDAEPEQAPETGQVPAEPAADDGSGPSVQPASALDGQEERTHTVATLVAALEQTNAALELVKAELREQQSRIVRRLESLEKKYLVPCLSRGAVSFYYPRGVVGGPTRWILYIPTHNWARGV